MNSATRRVRLTTSTRASRCLLALASWLLLAAVPAKANVGLSPASGHQGDTVIVQITGTDANFVQDNTQASFGPGISVGGAAEGQFGPVTVISPTLARASVVISPSARAGQVTATVFTFTGGPFMQFYTVSFIVQVSSPFYIQSYQVGQPLPGGKCLDYGPPRPDTGATVFLNDCAGAHPILVREINDQHDVILYAGTQIKDSQVIGIHNPILPRRDDSPSVTAPMYSLELQNALRPTNPSYYNQVFSLDGDSIILAKSRPCVNNFNTTDFSSICPPAPPQLVVQVRNARGANYSPLVAAPRNLADNEFWDFVASDGSGGDPTSGFVHVARNDQLWNAICASPPATCDANGNCTPPPNTDPTRPGPSAPCDTFNASWGSVIVITSPIRCDMVPGETTGQKQDVGFCIDMSAYAPLVLPAGVTLRGAGGRRGINLGAQLYAAYYFDKTNYRTQGNYNCGSCMIEVLGDYVRITGLRLRGQSRATHYKEFNAAAIQVDSVPASRTQFVTAIEFIATVDHNDISDWEREALLVDGGQNVLGSCGRVQNDQRKQNNVHIARNFLHHNARWSGGYGVDITRGGRAFIEGNTFLWNRHSVASDGEAHSQYRAWYNLVLRRVPDYTRNDSHSPFDVGPQQDFDMQGTGPDGYRWLGGYEVDIAGNTLLGHTEWPYFPQRHPRPNFELRGIPCVEQDYFRDNVTRQNKDNTIFPHNIDGDVNRQGPDVPSTPVTVPFATLPCDVFCQPSATVLAANNRYLDSSGFDDPTDGAHPHSFGVGDFDGDGVDDLFYASGAAWYYSPGGKAEWRFLSAKPDMLDSLLLGDFDGDRRTDVVSKRGASLLVSWGGISDWEVLNPSDDNLARVQVTDLHVGKFLDHPPGEQRDDIFLADGTRWFLSSGGSGPFNYVQDSGNRVSDLRFGVFAYDGDGRKTDVFGVVSFGGNDWRWAYSKNAQGAWADGVLRPAMRDNNGNLIPVDNLVVADFDGDGYVDVATNNQADWTISFNGRGDWTHFNVPFTHECFVGGYAGIGHFAGNAGADVLIWNGPPVDTPPSLLVDNGLCIAMGGAVPAANPWTGGRQRWSRQDMR